MAEDNDSNLRQTQKSVFISDFDSFVSKNIAAVGWSQ